MQNPGLLSPGVASGVTLKSETELNRKLPFSLNLLSRHCVEVPENRPLGRRRETMNGVDLVEKLAEMQRKYADAHRPVYSTEYYRARHARRHLERDYDGERHVSQYLPRK